jgi:GntR family transcriptional regulator
VNPLDITLDFRSGVPIYVQLVEQVQHLVLTGKLNAGDQLPTVRQLASELRVNFNTVARAYRMLDEAGLISTQQGRGTYILDQPTEGLADRLKAETLEVQVTRFLSSLRHQGYALQEVQSTLNRKLDQWTENNPEETETYTESDEEK